MGARCNVSVGVAALLVLLYFSGVSGFLFRAQPTLMTLESSAMIMDATFVSQEEEGRARLLKIMQEFLVSEAAKHAQKEKSKTNTKGKQAPTDVNMEELVGNTDGFADSG